VENCFANSQKPHNTFGLYKVGLTSLLEA